MRTDARIDPVLGKVARLYYEHGLTHAEIADLQGLSRVKVTRLLAEARRLGVVEIRVHSDDRPFVDLEADLVDRFGLQSAWICPAFGLDADRSLASLGLVGAECLTAVLSGVRTVAVGLSMAVAASVAQLRDAPATDLEVIPVAGSRGGLSNLSNPHELALGLASAFGGRTYHLPAPLLASTPEAAAMMRQDEAVRSTVERAAHAEALVLGIGGMTQASPALRTAVTDQEFAALREQGAVGDVSARFFDADGEPGPGRVDERVVGLDLAAMRGIPTRIGIAGGPDKREALHAALTSGLVDVVVTDVESARAALEASDRGARRPA